MTLNHLDHAKAVLADEIKQHEADLEKLQATLDGKKKHLVLLEEGTKPEKTEQKTTD